VSEAAIGAILSQGSIGKKSARKFRFSCINDAEKKNSTIEKELLAVYAVRHFRSYLYSKRFILVTDYKPLTWLHKAKDPTSLLARWKIKLAEYDYEIVYKIGKTNERQRIIEENPIQIYMIQSSLTKSKNVRKTKKPILETQIHDLSSSPQRGSMIKKSELECKTSNANP